MNAPAIPPPPAPMRARSKTERDFMIDFVWGAADLTNTGEADCDIEVEKKKGVFLVVVGLPCRIMVSWEFETGLGVEMRAVVRWVKRVLKSEEIGWWQQRLGGGRPREASISELFLILHSYRLSCPLEPYQMLSVLLHHNPEQ